MKTVCEKSIKAILQDVNIKINENITKMRENGEFFNLLEISGINKLEVKMCKILAELLNPIGSHYQNILFLKRFVKSVLQLEIDDDELMHSQVVTEYLTDKNRRIDIVIITSQRFIPIEVKLYADDQKNQCSDYYVFSKSKGVITSKVYYLTIDGHLPHENEGLTPIVTNNEVVGYEEIIPLSFSTDVCNWLADIASEISDKPMLYTSMIQFKEALENLGGSMNKKINNEIADLISETSDSFKSALSISESVNIAKENILQKIFEMLEMEMNILGCSFEQLHNKYDYKFNDYYSIHNYYKKKTSPALVYKYKKIDNNKDIWFIIELGAWGGLYCGFVLAENGENPQELILSDEEIKMHFKNLTDLNKEDWWFYWRYLPFHDGEYMPETNPDFRSLNEAYLSLFDTDKLKNFIDNVIKIIYVMLDDVVGMPMIDMKSDPFYSGKNQQYLMKSLEAYKKGDLTQHELIEVEDE